MNCTLENTEISNGFCRAWFKLDCKISAHKQEFVEKIWRKKIWCQAIDDFTVNKYGVSVMADFHFDPKNDPESNSIVVGSFLLNTALLERNENWDEKNPRIFQDYQQTFADNIKEIVAECVNHFNWFDDTSYFIRHQHSITDKKALP